MMPKSESTLLVLKHIYDAENRIANPKSVVINTTAAFLLEEAVTELTSPYIVVTLGIPFLFVKVTKYSENIEAEIPLSYSTLEFQEDENTITIKDHNTSIVICK